MSPRFHHILILLCLPLLLTDCAADRPFYAEKPAVAEPPEHRLIYSVFLVGDTGNVSADTLNPTLKVLQRKLLAAGERSAVVFLGDQLYPRGIPPEGTSRREIQERRLSQQLDALKEYPGRIVLIPGNHDWANSGKEGLAAVQRMESFVESYLDRGNIFLPDNGFPGPVDLELMDKDEDSSLGRDIRLLILDTQWWLHPHQKSFGDTGEYELHDSGDFVNELTDIMRKRRNDHLIVAGHHPLFSNGTHGGSFPWERHLLPPVGGSLYILYRKFLGFEQDIPHFRYQTLKGELLRSFKQAESLVYAAGHEHLLQHNILQEGRYSQHHVVSGSGSDSDYAARGKGASFVSRRQGFAVVTYYADRSSWLEFWDGENQLLYRRRLLAPTENPFSGISEDSTSRPEEISRSLRDSIATVAANPAYDEAGWVHRTVLGSHNRQLWATPVEAPIFDLEAVRGGLKPLKMGGTGQSTTLRLQDKAGRTYVLRSVDKEAARIWDASLRNTFASDLAQDQFSILNPYGAFIVPRLAETAGIYHTHPELYVIPDDPRLGRFSKVMKGELALFEERPDDDMSHAPHLSGSEEVISSRALFREVEGDIDHRVDQKMFMKNRLLDLLISDWDRHEDQWRWAAFEPADKKGKIYRPIPRDRDMAFIFMNGIVPTVGKASFFIEYQDFRNSYGNLKGLTKNSLSLSRRFTNELGRNEWKSAADSLRKVLDDETIDQAVARMPEEIYAAKGSAIGSVLKQRRDKLTDVALEYYALMARVSDVVGSHKRELFIIESYPGDSLRVQVKKLKKGGEIERTYFNRTYYANETREVRIYGLGGDDRFEIGPYGSDAIRVRVIGGSGRDEFTGPGDTPATILIYDNRKGSTFRNIGSFRIRASERPDVNRYEYGFQYNRTDPLLYFGSNRDDGLFFGGGIRYTRHGFRKQPAAAIHRFRGNFAVQTQAFNLRYDGHFARLAGEWDGSLSMDMLLPNNIRNFYGLGNETDDSNRQNDFYQARLWQYRIKPLLQRTVATGISFSAGPYFQVTKVRQDEGRFVGQPQAGISANTFDDQWFAGAEAGLKLVSLDHFINPRQGFRWNSRAALNLGVRNTTRTYGTISSSLSLYASPVLNPQLTIATRFAMRHHWGAFPFYESNTLGGKNTLRGLLSHRYSGRSSFVNNIEGRAKLFDFQNYLLGGEFGVLGFFDHGRVWTDGENSRRWHYGAGGGVWLSLFDMAMIRGSLGFAEGSYNMLAGAGFFF